MHKTSLGFLKNGNIREYPVGLVKKLDSSVLVTTS